MTNEQSQIQESNWKSSTLLVGGLTGLVVGLLAAYLYVRAAEENGDPAPKKIKTMDMMGLAVTLLSIVRQITDLGANGGKSKK
ncbi:MAG: hypothetical protein JXQ72_17550 [Anaerolineae bacterium]|nr:hypothetical protein [Anaerolineae bacterium]